jgi:uncharacterized protein
VDDGGFGGGDVDIIEIHGKPMIGIGANRTDEFLLKNVVDRILSVASPVRIILFGSAARGEMTPDSDVDLLVLESDPGDVLEESIRLRTSLRGLGVPFDVLVMSNSEFEERKDVIGSLAHPAYMEGKIIYESA